MSKPDGSTAAESPRAAAIRQYLAAAQHAAGQMGDQLCALAAIFNRLEAHLLTADPDWGEADWRTYAATATAIMQEAVPLAGVAPGRLLLDLNAKVSNIQLLVKDNGLRPE